MGTETTNAPRSCNRHTDCDKADEEARAKAKAQNLRPDHFGHRGADHCHDECCEDCFGC